MKKFIKDLENENFKVKEKNEYLKIYLNIFFDISNKYYFYIGDLQKDDLKTKYFQKKELKNLLKIKKDFKEQLKDGLVWIK